MSRLFLKIIFESEQLITPPYAQSYSYTNGYERTPL